MARGGVTRLSARQGEAGGHKHWSGERRRVSSGGGTLALSVVRSMAAAPLLQADPGDWEAQPAIDHFFDHFGVRMRDRACASVMVNVLK